MTKYSSEPTIINAPCEEVYQFMADFNNFESLMPQQVSNWKSDAESCSFTIEGLSNLSMRFNEKDENNWLSIISHGQNPIDYTLDIFFKQNDEKSCEVVIEFEASLNAFMRMLADKPLQNFVNLLADKLKEHYQ